MSGSFYVNSKIPDSISFNNTAVEKVYYNNNLVWDRRNRLIKFSSPGSFDVQCYISTYNSNNYVWDGIMEYSLDNGATWQEWEQKDPQSGSSRGTARLYAGKNNGEYSILYRGTGNTYINGDGGGVGWSLYGSDIKVSGNLSTLYDYQTIAAGGEIEAPYNAFDCFFYGETELVEADIIFPRKVDEGYADDCQYNSMFYGCSNLVKGPEAIEARGDCSNMFENCSKLKTAPKLAGGSFYKMFKNCTSLTETPVIPGSPNFSSSISLTYNEMFMGCTKLRKIQSLWSLRIPGTDKTYALTTPTDEVQYNMYKDTGILFSAVPTDVCTNLAYTLNENQVYYTNAEVFYPEE